MAAVYIIMRIAIMQPYLFPYIGYFQLINAVNEFVLYDNIEFTKKGWINRNRILINGKDSYITFPLKKDSDFLQVKDRFLSDNWREERKKMLNKISELYRKASQFETAFPVIKNIFLFDELNLFTFILNSLQQLNAFLNIQTPVTISSAIPVDHSLRSESKVVAICRERNANEYINPIGGVELYHKDTFSRHGIKLRFLKTGEVIYKQFNHEFIPYLSIIDVMMFNPKEKIKSYIDNEYVLIDNTVNE